MTENNSAILYYSDLRGHWPDAGAARFARALPYAKRLATDVQELEGRQSLAGVSLARRVLAALLRREEAQRLTPQTALARWVATEAALKAHGASVREAQLFWLRSGARFVHERVSAG